MYEELLRETQLEDQERQDPNKSSRYSYLLLTILKHLKEKLDAKNKLFAFLMLEAPGLTLPH